MTARISLGRFALRMTSAVLDAFRTEAVCAMATVIRIADVPFE